jgi:hypothetical protein
VLLFCSNFYEVKKCVQNGKASSVSLSKCLIANSAQRISWKIYFMDVLHSHQFV